MSTKTIIQNLINTNLADASSITAAEHRAVENALLNELYPTPIYESSESTYTITSKNSAIATNLYGVSIVKQVEDVNDYFRAKLESVIQQNIK